MNDLVIRIVSTGSSLGTAGLASLAGMPWGVVALLVLGALAIALLQAVMPQNSGDRLNWWISFWARKNPPGHQSVVAASDSLDEVENQASDDPSAAPLTAVGSSRYGPTTVRHSHRP